MDALLSFFRDTRNSMICAVLFLFFAGMYIFGWLAERALPERAAHPVAPPAATTSAPPVAPAPAPAPEPDLAPTVAAISPYCLPDTAAEMRAWIAGLPAGTPIQIDDAWFTPAEVARLADVWERAAH